MCLGIPGKIINICNAEQQLAIVDVGGIQREVNLGCVSSEDDDLQQYVGNWVLVHVGFAMSVINEEEAQATLDILTELGEVQEELAAIQLGEA